MKIKQDMRVLDAFVHVRACVHAFVCMSMCVCVYVHACVRACMCVTVCVCVCVHNRSQASSYSETGETKFSPGKCPVSLGIQQWLCGMPRK